MERVERIVPVRVPDEVRVGGDRALGGLFAMYKAKGGGARPGVWPRSKFLPHLEPRPARPVRLRRFLNFNMRFRIPWLKILSFAADRTSYKNLTQVFDVGEDAPIAVNACFRRHINHKLQ